MRHAGVVLVMALTLGCEAFQADPVRCDGDLVDLQTDPGHCGACGVACVGIRGVLEGRCEDGACVIETCERIDGTVRIDANGRPEDGCEVARATCDGRPVDLRADPNHCGTCGHICGDDPAMEGARTTACRRGVCVATDCHPRALETRIVTVEGEPLELSTCGPAGPECSPEICNSLDDDCDGAIDECEGPPGTEQAWCDPDLGACPPVQCDPLHVAVDGDPEDEDGCECTLHPAEACNGADDDCDGRTDEDLGDATCGVGACTRTVSRCVDGVARGCTPATPTDERCNGIDDDCDGRVDEDPELTAVEATCETGSPGRCAAGTPACVEGAPACVAREEPGEEACNDVDDDCDGQTDEGLGTITCGVGACRSEAPICVGGAAGACEPGRPAAEICNRIDDDCDGRIDEQLGADPRLAGGVCETGLAGACALGALACDAGEVRCVPTEPAPETCNDVDDDCDDAIDETIAPVTCGVGQCERTVSGCQDGVPVECIPGQSSAEICDGVDNDCDGLDDVTEGVCPGCVVPDAPSVRLTELPSAGEIRFDLVTSGASVVAAWRGEQALSAVGCDPAVGPFPPLLLDLPELTGELDARLDGAGRPFVTFADRAPFEGAAWDPGTGVWRLRMWAVAFDEGPLAFPLIFGSRFGCRDPEDGGAQRWAAPYGVVEPRAELVYLGRDCPGAGADASLLSWFGLDGEGAVAPQPEDGPLALPWSDARVCRADRMRDPGGTGLAVVTADRHRGGAPPSWRLDLLLDDPAARGPEWRSFQTPGADQPGSTPSLDGACPAVVRSEVDRLMFFRPAHDLDDDTRTMMLRPAPEAFVLDPASGWAPLDGDAAAHLAVQPAGDGESLAMVEGSLSAIDLTPRGHAVAWQTRSGNTRSFHLRSDSPAATTNVFNCPDREPEVFALLDAGSPVLVWSLRDGTLYAAAGGQFFGCVGQVLARGAPDVLSRHDPTVVRRPQVRTTPYLYWVDERQVGGGPITFELRRARLDAAAATETVERGLLRAEGAYRVQVDDAGWHHVLWLRRLDARTAAVSYRVLGP